MKSHLNNMNNEEKDIIHSLERMPVQLPGDDFFESLKKEVVAKIDAPQPKIVPFYSRRWIQVAASVLLVVGLGSLWILNSQPEDPLPTNKVDFSKVTREEVLDYLEEHHEDVETEDLIPYLKEVPVWTATLKTDSVAVDDNPLAQHEELWEDIDKQDILDYLEEESFDLDEELILGS